MKTVRENPRTTLEQTREVIEKYNKRRTTPQPDIEIGDQEMLNTKNIKRKQPTREFTAQLYGLIKIVENQGNRAFKLDIRARCNIDPVFHDSLLEPYKVSDPLNREQAPQEPEDVKGDLEWEVERIVKSETITYKRKVRRVNKEFKELRYFVKWAECSEDENTREPLEGLENAKEEVERFDRENQEIPGPNLDE